MSCHPLALWPQFDFKKGEIILVLLTLCRSRKGHMRSFLRKCTKMQSHLFRSLENLNTTFAWIGREAPCSGGNQLCASLYSLLSRARIRFYSLLVPLAGEQSITFRTVSVRTTLHNIIRKHSLAGYLPIPLID